MRDVTNSAPTENESQKTELEKTFQFLFDFAKHPLQEITKIPNWGWKKIFLIHICITIGSGIINGLIPPNIYQILFGIFLFPIISSISVFVLSMFFYYFFQVFEKKTVQLKQLFTTIVLANIPFFLFQSLSQLVPPISLVGFAFTGLLLIVGLSENFGLERKKSLRLIAGIFLVILILWISNKIRHSNL